MVIIFEKQPGFIFVLPLVAAGGEDAPSRFKRVLDKATGRHYYYDKETRETFWTLPEGPASVALNITPEDPRKRRKSEKREKRVCVRLRLPNDDKWWLSYANTMICHLPATTGSFEACIFPLA